MSDPKNKKIRCGFCIYLYIYINHYKSISIYLYIYIIIYIWPFELRELTEVESFSDLKWQILRMIFGSILWTHMFFGGWNNKLWLWDCLTSWCFTTLFSPFFFIQRSYCNNSPTYSWGELSHWGVNHQELPCRWDRANQHPATPLEKSLNCLH